MLDKTTKFDFSLAKINKEILIETIMELNGISEDFIKDNKHKFTDEMINTIIDIHCFDVTFIEYLIENYKVDWKLISNNQKLSEEFLNELCNIKKETVIDKYIIV